MAVARWRPPACPCCKLAGSEELTRVQNGRNNVAEGVAAGTEASDFVNESEMAISPINTRDDPLLPIEKHVPSDPASRTCPLIRAGSNAALSLG